MDSVALEIQVTLDAKPLTTFLRLARIAACDKAPLDMARIEREPAKDGELLFVAYPSDALMRWVADADNEESAVMAFDPIAGPRRILRRG